MHYTEIPEDLLNLLKKGTVIPAMPLALNQNREFQEKRQRALTRYYIDAGSGGIAVGVHSTQFEIRDPEINLFEKVLSTVSEEIDSWCQRKERRILKIAGVCGRTEQAVKEAKFAVDNGYHAALLSLSAYKDDSIEDMLAHCQELAKHIPLIGFYLQPAVGGRILPYSFWRKFAEIDNLLAIKIAPFNRYQTLDVARAVCDAGRENIVTLYTGNDDNILIDLISEYKFQTDKGEKRIRIKGGLLGHWCVWTKKAVEQLEKMQQISNEESVHSDVLSLALQVTDCNAAFFDAANNFKGCIPGIHEVLRRQGLLEGTWCLNPDEVLSEGQSEEIDRVYKAYPELNDDEFVKENLQKWLS